MILFNQGFRAALVWLLLITNMASAQTFTSMYQRNSNDPTVDYYTRLGYYRVDPNWPHLWAYGNALFYRDRNGSLQPLTLEPDGRITYGTARNFYPHVDQEVRAMYASVQGTPRWAGLAQRLNQIEGGVKMLAELRTANPQIPGSKSAPTGGDEPGEKAPGKPWHSPKGEEGKRPPGKSKGTEPPVTPGTVNNAFNNEARRFNLKGGKKLLGITDHDLVTETNLKCIAESNRAHDYDVKLVLTEACRVNRGKKESRLYFDLLETIDPEDKDRVIDAKDLSTKGHLHEWDNAFVSVKEPDQDPKRRFEIRFGDDKQPSVYITGTKNGMKDRWICISKDKTPSTELVTSKKEPKMPSAIGAEPVAKSELEIIFQDQLAGVFRLGEERAGRMFEVGKALPLICGRGHKDRDTFTNVKYLIQTSNQKYQFINAHRDDERIPVPLAEWSEPKTAALEPGSEHHEILIRRITESGKTRLLVSTKDGICVSKKEMPSTFIQDVVK